MIGTRKITLAKSLNRVLFALTIAVLVCGCSFYGIQKSEINSTPIVHSLFPAVSVPEVLGDHFLNSYVKYYDGKAGIGINHIAYWSMSKKDIDLLPSKEQAKVARLRPNNISSKLFPPDASEPISGYEVTGSLRVIGGSGARTQRISLVIPDNWNGKLIVFGTSGVRNEYSAASLLSPWILQRGYATIGGDKGLTNGASDMYSGKHVTQHWGDMMIDLAVAGQQTLLSATGKQPTHTYAVGISNGGQQARLALEIDHARVERGSERLFDGGLTWSSVYFPRKEIMDVDKNGNVTPEEYASNAQFTLMGSHICAALTMGWHYAEASVGTTKEFYATPPFASAYENMVSKCGFHPDSAKIWGIYNTFFDWLKNKDGLDYFAGLGYFNRVHQPFLADFRGDNKTQSQAYSPRNLGTRNEPKRPTFYDFFERNQHSLGFNEKAVKYMLKISNSAEFSVPMIDILGTKDGIISFTGQGLAYQNAVKQFGNPELYRLYLISDGMHIDAHSDSGSNIDFDLNGVSHDVNIANEMTPVQGYAELAMDKLEDWVENGIIPVKGGKVATDPVTDKVIPF